MKRTILGKFKIKHRGVGTFSQIQTGLLTPWTTPGNCIISSDRHKPNILHNYFLFSSTKPLLRKNLSITHNCYESNALALILAILRITVILEATFSPAKIENKIHSITRNSFLSYQKHSLIAFIGNFHYTLQSNIMLLAALSYAVCFLNAFCSIFAIDFCKCFLFSCFVRFINKYFVYFKYYFASYIVLLICWLFLILCSHSITQALRNFTCIFVTLQHKHIDVNRITVETVNRRYM